MGRSSKQPETQSNSRRLEILGGGLQYNRGPRFYLLRSDVLRMATDSLPMRAALANLYGSPTWWTERIGTQPHSRLPEVESKLGGYVRAVLPVEIRIG